jgi:hypothetical protein
MRYVGASTGHIRRLAKAPATDLKDIGLDAAHEVVGEGRAGDIEVTTGPDSSDRPARHFTFLIGQDRNRDPMRAAPSRTRLARKIRDRLTWPYQHSRGRQMMTDRISWR